jgi:putative exporter of polyketide antibiotics
MMPDSCQKKVKKTNDQDRAAKLSRAISYLDDDIVEEALEQPQPEHKLSPGEIRKWAVPVVTCLLSAIMSAAAVPASQRNKRNANTLGLEPEGEDSLMDDGALAEPNR